MDQNKEPKDCLKCKRRGTAKCAFLNRSFKEKCRCLWVLYNDDKLEAEADRLAAQLHARLNLLRPGDRLPSSYYPGWFLQSEQKEMDYSRNDSQEIVNSMRPFNN